MFQAAAACFACLALATSLTSAEITTVAVDYADGDTALRGYFARPAGDAVVPGVLVVHEWWGHNAYAQQRARELAEAGFAAFALDMFGAGLETADPQQAGAWAGPHYQDNALLLRRARAGLATLRAQSGVDGDRLASIGFCFGGSVSLQLARAGEPLRGVVSFHGGLKTSTPAQADTLAAQILVLHGGADPLVPPTEVAEFFQEMLAAKASWRMEVYGTALHAFSNPKADPASGLPIAYDADAARRSMAQCVDFLQVVCAE